MAAAQPQSLDSTAATIRQYIIDMLQETGSGHTAGALGMVEMLTTLYWRVLKHKPQFPNWEERDRLILSNGHTCPGLYATLAVAGYFPTEELFTLRELGSRLQGHPHLGSLPGIEATSGPLGQGLSQGVGMALGFQMDAQKNRVYVLMGDGEQQEGQNWEAYWLAGFKKLDNLTVLIDRNHIQIDGPTERVLGLEPFAQKLTSFGWHVQIVDGHDCAEIEAACKTAQETTTQPSAIICNTVPGKGADFIENDYRWHGKTPDLGEAIDAIQEIRRESKAQ